MPTISADGANGEPGGDGFDFVNAAGSGSNGRKANCNWLDDDCAGVGPDATNRLDGGLAHFPVLVVRHPCVHGMQLPNQRGQGRSGRGPEQA